MVHTLRICNLQVVQTELLPNSDLLQSMHADTDGDGADLCAKIGDFGLHAALTAFDDLTETSGREHMTYTSFRPLIEFSVAC